MKLTTTRRLAALLAVGATTASCAAYSADGSAKQAESQTESTADYETTTEATAAPRDSAPVQREPAAPPPAATAASEDYDAPMEAPVMEEAEARPMPRAARKISAKKDMSRSARRGPITGKDKSYDFADDTISGELVRPDAIATRGVEGGEVHGTEDYKNYGVNEMTRSSEDNLSTFSIDVDTGAYTIARKKLQQGHLPPAAAVRVEEFVNYFSYNYASPDRGAFGVHIEAAPSPFTSDKDTYLMRVGVQGKRISPAERKPVHLTFLVDVSGSMGAPDKLPLAKKSLKLLTRNLRQNDTVALATYAGHTAKVLEPTSMKHRRKILNAIDSLGSGGGTGMSNGMELAYKMALSNFKREHVNRVIVVSDGDANIGPMSHQQIHERVRHYVAEGVTLSTIGFGMGNYKDTMMEQLANKGNGNYYYIDDYKEAQKVFESQLDGTLEVIAKDVKIQVEFDKDAIPEYRLIGYENRDIADKDFRDDKVDAGEIGAGHTVTALYEVKLNRRAEGRLATVRVRAKKPDGYTAAEQAFHFQRTEVANRVGDASKDFQFAASVAMFAEILRNSPYAKGISLDLVEEVARGATTGRQDDRREFLELVRKAKRLKRG